MASPDQIIKFQDEGYFVIEEFLTTDEVANLESGCSKIIEDFDPSEHKTVFSTTKQSYRDNYFLNSADNLSFFYEDGVLNDEGNLTVDKHQCLNKIGHALHVLSPPFRNVTFCKQVKDMCKSLKYEDPVVMQSMIIFKQPGIGGKVVPHQDATFLHTNPLSVMGLWIAMEDTTLDNGCLWFIPGSHKDGVLGDYRMVRNPSAEGQSCIFLGEKPSYNDADFVPVPIKKGSMIVIHGLVVHKSEANKSPNSRHIYTFHVYDSGTSEWSKENWLQPTPADTFTHINNVG